MTLEAAAKNFTPGRPPCVCRTRKIRCDDDGCDLAPIGVPFDSRLHCKSCWLWHNDETVRAGWGGRPGASRRPSPTAQHRQPLDRSPCRHLGDPTGETAPCQTCRGKASLRLFSCAVFGRCTQGRGLRSDGVADCRGCGRWEPRPEDAAVVLPVRDVAVSTLGPPRGQYLTAAPPAGEEGHPALRWAVGVTTVPERRETLLPRTLASLEAAGFDHCDVRLFVDGGATFPSGFTGVKMSSRFPRLHCAGNWLLALAELWLRDPLADRWAVFQDDLVACRNLRAYLEACPFPERGYLNLYTFASNQARAPKTPDGRGSLVGWYPSNQLGRGAVGLVFDRAGVVTLLSSRHVWARNYPDPKAPERRTKAIDGGIVTAMQAAGWAEWVHNPSLLQHTGDVSTVGNLPHATAPSFRGEGYDAMELVAEAIRQRGGSAV